MIDAEYEAVWDCPKCEYQTTKSDDDHIAHDDGSALRIKCAHQVDKGGSNCEPCGHEYAVNLRV